MENHNKLLFILISISIYPWYQMFKTRYKQLTATKQINLFRNRHNCVVQISKEQGLIGWPNATNEPICVYDPILYFIDTAEKSLDVAVMVIEIECFKNALIQAHKRGVLVRIIVDHYYGNKQQAKDMKDEGIPLLYYVGPDDGVPSIMHCKYMIKDYDNGRGYACVGSLNWSSNAIRTNFEDILYTGNYSTVTTMHHFFEDKWNYIDNLNKTVPFVKAKLAGLV